METPFKEAAERFLELLQLMAQLRAPGGCPWDAKQTMESIKPHTLEETYEVLDAIDRKDWLGLREELGDLLLQPVFLAEIAAGQNLFTVADSLRDINEKLIRRHPHIFGDAKAETADDVKKRWDEIKRQEKGSTGVEDSASALDGILRSLPALSEAQKISEKAAASGFEWPTIDGVLEKVREEAAEIAEVEESADQDRIEHELGDLLFTVVNLARWKHVDSEQALRKANARFRRRFHHVENGRATYAELEGAARLQQMEELWQEAKRLEKSAGGELG
jgi:MazG family protein